MLLALLIGVLSGAIVKRVWIIESICLWIITYMCCKHVDSSHIKIIISKGLPKYKCNSSSVW